MSALTAHALWALRAAPRLGFLGRSAPLFERLHHSRDPQFQPPHHGGSWRRRRRSLTKATRALAARFYLIPGTVPPNLQMARPEHPLAVSALRATQFGAAGLGGLIGLLHDLRKYSLEYQAYIAGQGPRAHIATAGAVEIQKLVNSISNCP